MKKSYITASLIFLFGAWLISLSAGRPAMAQEVDKVLPSTITMDLSTESIKDITANIPSGTSYAWCVPSYPGTTFRHSGANGFFAAKQPGTYYVGICYGNPIRVAWAVITVTPGPSEATMPSTPPVAAKSHALGILVVVGDISRDYDKMASFFATPVLADKMLSGGHVWRGLIDKNGKDAKGLVSKDALPYLAKAEGQALPYAFVIESSGSVRWRGPFPASPEAMAKLLTEK